MDQEKALLLKKYDHVWQRVTPDVDPYAVPAEKGKRQGEMKVKGGEERFLDRIASELYCRDSYLTLARRGGAGSRLFREMAMEEGRHARALMALWFLLTGELPPRQDVAKAAVPENKRQALRERYREACLSAEEYNAMAEAMQGDAAETLRVLAREERAHAAKLRDLLGQLL